MSVMDDKITAIAAEYVIRDLERRARIDALLMAIGRAQVGIPAPELIWVEDKLERRPRARPVR